MSNHLHLHRKTPLRDQPGKGHNRWHPDIAPGIRVACGATVELDCIDAVDTQVTPGMKHEEVLTCDLSRAHPLTGPVYVEGAEPGDLSRRGACRLRERLAVNGKVWNWR